MTFNTCEDKLFYNLFPQYECMKHSLCPLAAIFLTLTVNAQTLKGLECSDKELM